MRVTLLHRVVALAGSQSSWPWRRHFGATIRALCENNENSEKELWDPTKDRTKVIPVETSIQYLQSKAYELAYGNEPVWVKYRRNFKGQIPPRKTRKSCIVDDMVKTGNPCPICRDEYLIVDYRNTKLLSQFVDPYNGVVLHYSKTNVCMRQHQNLEVAVAKSRDYGLLPFYVPFRYYNYEEYYKPEEDVNKS